MQDGADTHLPSVNGHAPPPLPAASAANPAAAQPATPVTGGTGSAAAQESPAAAHPGVPGAGVGSGATAAGPAPASALAEAHTQYSASPPAKSEEASKESVVDVLSQDSVAVPGKQLTAEPAAAPASAPVNGALQEVGGAPPAAFVLSADACTAASSVTLFLGYPAAFTKSLMNNASVLCGWCFMLADILIFVLADILVTPVM